MRRFVVLAVLGACGGDGSDTPDAKLIDAVPATVKSVTCPGTVAFTFMANDLNTLSYEPASSTTITQGQVVKFVTSLNHNVVSGSAPPRLADPGLNLGFNMTGCFMFTAAGDYGFHCGPHGFAGNVVVQ